MTAVSAYAPTRRNLFLQICSTQSCSTRNLHRCSCLALLLLVIRFWDTPTLQRVRSLLRRPKLLVMDRTLLIERTRSIWEIISRHLESFVMRIKGLAYAEGKEEAPHLIEQLNGRKSVANEAASDSAGFRQNQRRIQAILAYWFGQYTPEISRKKLWMISSSSEAWRDKVDAEIADRFQDTISELVQKDGIWQDWCHDTELYGYAGKVASIVALDQFSRHVARHYNGKYCLIPPQAELDARAYETAQLFAKHHEQEIQCGVIPLPMYVFALIPYRHASTLASVTYVKECIERTVSMEEQINSLIGRFRNATNRRMAILQDEARRMGSVEHMNINCSAPSDEFPDEEILETFPFDADKSDAENHIVSKTIIAFLADRGVQPGSQSPTDKPIPVIVSLSGGVDSMVIAAVLAHLRSNCNYNLDIIVIHINYANRPESAAEASYVHRYCDKLGIEYKCRIIDEVTRGVTARDDYERIAREARFSVYRQTVEQGVNGDTTTEVGIMLGHHRGDLRENVLSNAHKGCGPLGLSGMTAVSKNDGVVIYRPLLSLEKTEIFDYAHAFGVPYFKDTTPHWSTRGKLRSKLLPLLREIYGEGSMDNLSTLATESDEARELLHKAVLAPFLDQVERKPMGITFGTKPWKEQSLFFWKFVLREALHSVGLGMFSNKSVVSFLERIKVNKVRSGWIQCRRDYGVYLDEEDGRVFVFFPAGFPFRKADQYDCAGKVVPFGKENVTSVGPWIVSSEVVEHCERGNVRELLEAAAVSSMESLFRGFVSYYIETTIESGAPRPLVFVQDFTKRTRPRAWKGTDLKVQRTLPLLGNDKAATKESAERTHRVLVRVTLMLRSA